jgi:hypothetical protein
MTFQTLANQTQKMIADNSPAILTGIGVAGAVTTAVLTGKAAIKADRLITHEQFRNGPITVAEGSTNPVLTPKEKLRLTWQLYIPPAVTGIVTVGAIIMANQIGTRRAAAMASAYVLSEKAFSEYKEKIVEKLGENKERAVRDDLAQDRVNRNPVEERSIIMTGGGDVLCFEPFTGRYFQSDMESLKKAQNDLNYLVLNNYYASLSDFYDLIGLDHTMISDDFGWNSDEMLELKFSTVLATDGRPCLSFEYKTVPIKGYARVH